MKQDAERMGGASSGAYSIRAVQRVCDLLDLIQAQPQGFSLHEVSQATALPKSSAFRYLATLEARRYVERDAASGNYRIGPAFLPLQSLQLDVLADRARPHLERLRDRFGETINLGLLDGNHVSYLAIVESPRSMRLAARRGDRDPLHCTALGKAIASLLPIERVRTILQDEGMPALTEHTVTDIDTFFTELERTREQGYALDNGENEVDGRCVAVPLIGAGLPTSISLSAPASRFPMEDVAGVTEALKEAAWRLVEDFGGNVLEDEVASE